MVKIKIEVTRPLNQYFIGVFSLTNTLNYGVYIKAATYKVITSEDSHIKLKATQVQQCFNTIHFFDIYIYFSR